MTQAARRVVLGLLSLGALGCASIRLGFDSQAGFDFATLKSYAWIRQEVKGPSQISAHVRNRVTAEINETLQAKGFVYAPASAADFLVSFRPVVEEKVSDPGRVGGIGQVSAAGREHNEGGLVIEIRDRRSGMVVWTGTARGFIATPADAEGVMVSSVEALLERFPPQ